MNKVVRPSVRTGSGSHSTRPAGTAQIGNAYGDHSTHRGDSTGYTGEKLHNPERNFQPVKFGNELAAKTVCGPGGSRNLYGQAGSQGTHGQPASGNAPAKGRDILSEYGPDYRKP
jgi:hypothetical protein